MLIAQWLRISAEIRMAERVVHGVTQPDMMWSGNIVEFLTVQVSTYFLRFTLDKYCRHLLDRYCSYCQENLYFQQVESGSGFMFSLSTGASLQKKPHLRTFHILIFQRIPRVTQELQEQSMFSTLELMAFILIAWKDFSEPIVF